MPSSRAGQVDFLARQGAFHPQTSNVQGPRQFVCQLKKKSKLRLAKRKQSLRAAFPNGKLEIKVFLSPVKKKVNWQKAFLNWDNSISPPLLL